VADAIGPYLREHFGNPSSAHAYGRRAHRALDTARVQVAGLLGAEPGEVVFTGSATEANNLALLGAARALGGTHHLLVSAVEHPAVLQPAAWLAAQGWALDLVPVDDTGRLQMPAFERMLRRDTVLVSVMHASNETGTLQPVEEVAAITRERGILLHVDAAQSPGKVAVDVGALGADLLTLAGHKFYAPKGVGALYVRTGTPLAPVMAGAGQERGLRPGTENVALIAGLGVAARLARERLPVARERLQALRERLHQALSAAVPGLALNGHPQERLPNTLNLSFPAVSGEALLQAVRDEVAASVGAACHGAGGAPSGVLAAMGLASARSEGAVRLSLGLSTTAEEVDRAAAALIRGWRDLAGGAARP
jgi:cysteine desulfurase